MKHIFSLHNFQFWFKEQTLKASWNQLAPRSIFFGTQCCCFALHNGRAVVPTTWPLRQSLVGLKVTISIYYIQFSTVNEIITAKISIQFWQFPPHKDCTVCSAVLFSLFLLLEHKLPKIMKSEKSVWWLLLCTWFASRLATQDFLTPQDLGGLSGHGAWQSQASPPSLCLCVCSQSRTTACQYWQRPRWQAKG